MNNTPVFVYRGYASYRFFIYMYPAAQTPISRIPMATVHILDFSDCVFSNPTSDPVSCDSVSVTLLAGDEM